MKPKVSTGYLTPQLNRINKTTGQEQTRRRSEINNQNPIDEDVLKELMKCPIKRKLVMELLKTNKDAVPPESRENKTRLESPIALMRRRQLEAMNGSGPPVAMPERGTPKPFDEVFCNVVAYVEVFSQGEDRSAAVKSVLKSMGATVTDRLSRDVTHVIFRDGSFTTYRKAHLRKKHVVSILWVEFSRKYSQRQPEKNYPAIKAYHELNDSSICSQMQKDYEDLVKDEYTKSIVNGTPLPSTRALIDKRKSIMSPVSSCSSQEMNDQEVAAINSKITDNMNQSSNELSNSSDSAIINGSKSLIGVDFLKKIRGTDNKKSESDMELTTIGDNSPTDSFYNAKTPQFNKPSRTLSVRGSTRRNTIAISENIDPNINANSTIIRSSDESSTVSKLSCVEASIDQSNSCILSGNVCKTKRSAEMSSLKISDPSKNNSKSTVSSNMSSLKLSVEKPSTDKVEKSSMSSLHLSSEKSQCRNKDPSFITVRKKYSNPNKNLSISSDDSEIDIPIKKPLRKLHKKDDTPKTRKRKLFTPGDEPLLTPCDDLQERLEKRQEVQKTKPNKGVIPVLTIPLRKLPQLELEDIDNVTPKKQQRRKKREVKDVSFDSSLDEQKDLLEYVLNKKDDDSVKTPKNAIKERSARTDPSNKKNKPNKSSNKESVAGDLAKTPLVPKATVMRRSVRLLKTQPDVIDKNNKPTNRRSTLDFQSASQMNITKKLKGGKQQMPTIVCTRLHKPDVGVFTQIVKKIGGFIVENEVTNRTTHLVAGESRRTINMLRALARGCWILSYEWVLKSLDNGKWLPEEDFEVTEFSPVVQKCRLERQAFGSSYTTDVFRDSPPIFVALDTVPRCSDLRELITLCRGKVVTSSRMAKIVVGEHSKDDDVVCVNENWILDSITFNKKMPFKKYLLKKKGGRQSVVV